MSRPARPLAESKAERLLETAAEAFAQSGLEGASLNGILRRAQMGKGSFYHHFADKAALHDWVTNALSQNLLEQVQPPKLESLTATNFHQELAQLLDRTIAIAASNPELMNLGRIFHNSADTCEQRAITRVRRTLITWITGALRAGRSLGVIRQDLPIDLLTDWTIASLTVIDQWTLTTATPNAIRRPTTKTAIDVLWQLLTTNALPTSPTPVQT